MYFASGAIFTALGNVDICIDLYTFSESTLLRSFCQGNALILQDTRAIVHRVDTKKTNTRYQFLPPRHHLQRRALGSHDDGLTSACNGGGHISNPGPIGMCSTSHVEFAGHNLVNTTSLQHYLPTRHTWRWIVFHVATVELPNYWRVFHVATNWPTYRLKSRVS